MNKAFESFHSPENVAEKVRRLSSKVRKLIELTTLISFGSIFIGMGVSIYFGPPALAIGVTVAAIVTFWLKLYAIMRKREVSREVLDLTTKHLLSESDAEKINNEIRQIYGEPQG